MSSADSQKVTIFSDFHNLEGMLKKTSNKEDIVIFLHALASDMNQISYIELQENLASKNISSFRYNLNEVQKKEGISPGKANEPTSITLSDTYTYQQHLNQVISSMQRKGYKRTHLYVVSSAALVINEKNLQSEVSSIFLKCPVVKAEETWENLAPHITPEEWNNSEYTNVIVRNKKIKIPRTMYQHSLTSDLYTQISSWKTSTELVIGKHDQVCLAETARDFGKQINAQVWEVNSGHFFTQTDYEFASACAIQFFVDQVQAQKE